MGRELNKIYSEVYSVLEMLGDGFVNKLPAHLYTLIQEEKLHEYNPQYTLSIALEEQDIKKEALSMIALFHLTYWCETPEEREALTKKLEENKVKNEEKNINAELFPKRQKNIVEPTEIHENLEIIEKKESILQKIINRIKRIFLIRGR